MVRNVSRLAITKYDMCVRELDWLSVRLTKSSIKPRRNQVEYQMRECNNTHYQRRCSLFAGVCEGHINKWEYAFERAGLQCNFGFVAVSLSGQLSCSMSHCTFSPKKRRDVIVHDGKLLPLFAGGEIIPNKVGQPPTRFSLSAMCVWMCSISDNTFEATWELSTE